MWKRFAVFLALAFAANAWSQEPWNKSYKEWGEKEVRRVLTDSPWSKAVRVPANWNPQSASQAQTPQTGVPTAASDSSSMGGAAYPGAAAGAQQAAGLPSVGESAGGATSEATFLVRWASSQTVRRALVRASVLRGGMQEADAEKYLAEQAQEYQIMVVGPDMTPFRGVDEIDLRGKTYLRPKKSKQKLMPTRVEIERAADGKRIAAVIFHFAKSSPSGEAVIASDEKGVEFVCQASGAVIKLDFDAQKMVTKEGRDL